MKNKNIVSRLIERGDRFVGKKYYDVVDIIIPHAIDGMDVKIIGDCCFMSARFLERVVIPEGVQEIGESAFMLCNNLYKVFLPSHMDNIGDSAFSDTAIEAIVLPEGIRNVGSNMFYGCRKLKELFIPFAVVNVSRAFEYCESLEKLFLPDSVKNIEGVPQYVNFFDFIAPERAREPMVNICIVMWMLMARHSAFTAGDL